MSVALLQARVDTLETKMEELIKICHELNKMILDTAIEIERLHASKNKSKTKTDDYTKGYDDALTYVRKCQAQFGNKSKRIK